MKRILIVAIILFILISFMTLKAQWVKSYGGSSMDFAYSIWQTNDGGYVVAGNTSSFGVRSGAIWILKLSADGEIEWQKTYGGSGSDHAYSIQQTIDGGFIVAGSTSFGAGSYDVWILKLYSDGDIEWQRTYGGINREGAESIQQTSDGGYVVAGETSPTGTGDSDFWILKLSNQGEIEWQKTYGGSGSDHAYSIQQTTDGGFIAAGSTSSFDAGSNDFWILKLFPDGKIAWQKTYGGNESDYAYSIQQTMDGGFIVAGRTQSFGVTNGAIWILKLSSKGDIEWQKSYRGDEYDHEKAKSIQQTIDGGYIVAGSHSSFGTLGNDFWILKLSTVGDIEWQKKYGVGFPDYVNSIKQTTDGGYIVAGYNNGWGLEETDFWILKLSSNGELPTCCDLIRSTDVSVTNTETSPEDTNITPQDTSIKPQETNISPSETNAIVYNFCSGKYILKITATKYYGTTDPSPGIYTYDPGTTVTIKAIPSYENAFSGWQGDASGKTSPLTIIMDSHKSIKATFIGGGGGFGVGDIGPGCFIGTAAYGTPMADEVKILGVFRDKYLLTNQVGRAFIRLYYEYSPGMADFIRKRKLLRAIVRDCLKPIVWIIKLIIDNRGDQTA